MEKRDKVNLLLDLLELRLRLFSDKKSLSNSLEHLCYTVFIHWSFETQIRKQNSLQNALRKSSPTITTFVEEVSNFYDYFFWGFRDFLMYLAK